MYVLRLAGGTQEIFKLHVKPPDIQHFNPCNTTRHDTTHTHTCNVQTKRELQIINSSSNPDDLLLSFTGGRGCIRTTRTRTRSLERSLLLVLSLLVERHLYSIDEHASLDEWGILHISFGYGWDWFWGFDHLCATLSG